MDPLNSSSLAARDLAVNWHPYTQMKSHQFHPPLAVTRAKGIYLYDEEGRRYLDGISSWWVNLHGHGHPRITAALCRQAGELQHVLFAGVTHPPAVLLSEMLLQTLPAGLRRIFYSDDGSTAVEVALKMALQYWRNLGRPEKIRFVSLENAYHGDTVGAMSVSRVQVFNRVFAPLLFAGPTLPAPCCPRCPQNRSPSTCAADCLEEGLVRLEPSVPTLAALILEPLIQGAGGMNIYPPAVLDRLGEFCRRQELLLLYDEVFTGFGRTGTFWAAEQTRFPPDLLCTSKCLSAGCLPLAATAATAAVYQAFLGDEADRTFFHGHSFTANPLAAAVAIESLRLFRENDLLGRVAEMARIYARRLAPWKEKPYVRSVRWLGQLAAAEIDTGADPDKPGYLDDFGPRFFREMLQEGVYLRPLGNVVYLLPPPVIAPEELEGLIDRVETVLDRINPRKP